MNNFRYYNKYPNSLKDPLWQTKRLEIFTRDCNKCQKCGGVKELHCHHIHYHFTWAPWEHPNSWMITVCKSCHHNIHRKEGYSHDLLLENKPDTDFAALLKEKWLAKKLKNKAKKLRRKLQGKGRINKIRKREKENYYSKRNR